MDTVSLLWVMDMLPSLFRISARPHFPALHSSPTSTLAVHPTRSIGWPCRVLRLLLNIDMMSVMRLSKGPNPRVVLALRILWAVLILGCEYATFAWTASQCPWPSLTSTVSAQDCLAFSPANLLKQHSRRSPESSLSRTRRFSTTAHIPTEASSSLFFRASLPT